MKDFSELNALQVDALKEISNIGAGNAATALSQMLNRRIDMSVPNAKLAPFPEIVEYVGGADVEVAGGYLRVDGGMPMGILFLVQSDMVFNFLDILFGRPRGSSSEWDEMLQSAFLEINNILAGSFLNALSTICRQTFSPSVPAMAVDMVGAIIGEVLQQIGEVSDYALVVETVFSEKENEFKGHFFILPEPQTLEILLSSLGVL